MAKGYMKKQHQPQTTLPNAIVIRKFGKWTIEQYTNPNTHRPSYAISDGYAVHYPVIYDSGKVAFDNPYVIPKTVRAWMENYGYMITLGRR